MRIKESLGWTSLSECVFLWSNQSRDTPPIDFHRSQNIPHIFKMDELSDNELGFITNTLGLETNPLFNDELNLNSISHDYIKSEDDLFLTNDENWLSSLDNESAFSHLSLNASQVTQNGSLHHHNLVADQDSIASHHGRSVNPNDLQKSSILAKKRKLDLFDQSNASFANGLLSNDVEISSLGKWALLFTFSLDLRDSRNVWSFW